ncbi:bifunctional sulfate adenylyltransferase subunit 1/adenylylsulfate kinase [Salinibacter sp. 10B]|uniref:sulfate adenylyltransferase subunit CysN n=1 Tax=Salinibacter sp. 10B TaxID=1923971 RepID=UPI000CF4FA2F|nr:sulfate adenylyltransferase subunit CysN [Salinibacter sp. 10B]PQJ34770.1 bifunctional sulfate adenylyltransferase subunit 1/adenylylsulfate kinase [Salinibacter sp. 10B]
MDVLRFTTAGSVDDGKSTLIGRLFYDTQQIFEDKLEEIKRNTQRDDDDLELALLTDGLKAEREQGITIDVAYRYFSTPNRKFIIADTPGHEQYTRNMVTGASTAELAVELIDARNGVIEQTRRHAFIASLLQIPYMIVAVNKMDLVDYGEERFREIVEEFQEFSDNLDINDITFIPISALKGDNVVDQSERMPWYKGPTLLHRLENVRPEADRNQVDFRFPVQHVIRPHQDFRGFAGQVASGKIRPGEEIVVLPSKRTSHIESITTLDGEVEEAGPGDSIVISLTDEIDVSRGSMIVRSRNRPDVTRQLDADLCWMNEEKMRRDRPYIIQHTTRRTQANVSKVVYRTNVETFHREEADTFELNDIGRVELETADPLFIDPYKINRSTGNFILIDPDTNDTVAAGMIRGVSEDVAPFGRDEVVTDKERETSPNVVWEGLNIPREDREEKNGHKSAVVWLTGLSGSGKSTIAKEVEKRLFDRDVQTMMLDGDNVRHGLSGDLGFSPNDRKENIRRVGEAARLFFEQGNVTLCSFISPYQEDRDRIRELLPEGRFFEVHVDCPLEVCKERDTKGLYKKAEEGEIANFTGVSAPYEEPQDPEIVVDSDQNDVETCVNQIIEALEEEGIV